MFAPMKHMALLALAAAGVAVVGCDDLADADKAVQQKLEQGARQVEDLDTTQLGEDPTIAKPALDTLQSAADTKAAGPIWRATAGGAAGDANYQTALAGMVELLQTERDMRSALIDLRAAAQQVAYSNYLASGLAERRPDDASAKVNQIIAGMQGNAQTPTWTPGGELQLPTLAAVRQKISELEGEIAKVTEQMTALSAERAQAVASADKLLQQSEAQQGDESVASFKQATDARHKAEDARVALEKLQADLDRLQSDLALAKAQADKLSAGIEGQQSQAASLQSGWEQTQQAIKAQRKIASSIATGGDDVAVTIDQRVKTLKDLQQKAQTQRQVIANQLREAAKYFEQAASASKQFVPTPAQSKHPAMKPIRETIHVNRYNLKLGLIDRELGTLSANEARLNRDIENTRAALQTALSGAELSTPGEMPSVDMSVITGMVTEAESKLTAAEERLLSISSGDTPRHILRQIQTARLITFHRLIELQDLKQSLAMEGSNKEMLLNVARAFREEMINNAFPIPALPGELGKPAPVSSTSTPESPEAPPTVVPGATSPDTTSPDTTSPDTTSPDTTGEESPTDTTPAPAPFGG